MARHRRSYRLLILLLAAWLLPQHAIALPSGPTNPVSSTLWNGFIDLVNILELTNNSSAEQSFTVILYDSSGVAQDSLPVRLAPGAQQDLILNEFAHFKQDSYGLIEVHGSALAEGRLVYYRPAAEALTPFLGGAEKSFDFVFSLPLSVGRLGLSNVGFNTSAIPGPSGSSMPVANWLSLVNLDSVRTLEVSVRKRDQSGSIISDQTLNLQPRQRIDYDGGHGFPGPNRTGSISIVPTDPSIPYLAHLIRYAVEATPGGTRYGFGIPFIAVSGSYLPTALAIRSTIVGFPTQNWIELTNTAPFPNTVAVSFRDQLGAIIPSAPKQIELAAGAQVHLDAASLLATVASETGSVELDGSRNLIADSVVYSSDSAGAGISSAYAVQSFPLNSFASGTTLSWNRFLGMTNTVTALNAAASSASTTAPVFSFNTLLREVEMSVGASRTKDFIVDGQEFGTSIDHYGRIEINSALVPTLVRSRTFISSSNIAQLDFLHYIAPSGSWYFSSGSDNPFSPRYQSNEVSVFILAGQSNAVGPRRDPTTFVTEPEDNKIIFAYRNLRGGIRGYPNAREAVENDANWSSSGSTFTHLRLQAATGGAEIAWARNLYQSNLCGGKPCRDRRIAILKYGVGSSTLHGDWLGTGPDDAKLARRFIEFVQSNVEALRAQGLVPKVRGMLWIQGESDTDSDAAANAYYVNLRTFLQRTRSALQLPGLPVLLAELRTEWTGTTVRLPRALTIRNAEFRVANEQLPTGIVATRGLSKIPTQPIHYDPAGIDGLGIRAYNELLNVVP